MYPVGQRQLLGRKRQELRPEDLQKLVLLHEDDGSLWRRWFAAAGMPDVDVTRGPRILETGLTIDAAIAGQGIALADDGLIGDALADRRLAKLSSIALADGCYYLLKSRYRQAPPTDRCVHRLAVAGDRAAAADGIRPTTLRCLAPTVVAEAGRVRLQRDIDPHDGRTCRGLLIPVRCQRFAMGKRVDIRTREP